MKDTGCLGLVHWDDPEGWYREGGGRGFQDVELVHLWQIHVDVWQNQYSIVKQNKVNFFLNGREKVKVGTIAETNRKQVAIC